MKLNEELLDNVERRDKVYKIFDGQGLYIEVPPHGSLRWRYKYTHQGSEKRISLGVYPKVGIDEARRKHMEMRQEIKNGIKPIDIQKEVSTNKPNSLREQQLLDYIQELETIIKETRQSMREMLILINDKGR